MAPTPQAPKPPARNIARNAIWNLVGQAAPMLVGLLAIPYLIHAMGKERFGLLTIIWMGVGYFSLFDMGFGRALTKLVAERLGRNDTSDLHSVIWTALWLVSGLGLIGMCIVFLISQPLIVRVLNVPLAMHAEGVASFRLLALCLPFTIATTAVVGILEAHQRFARIAAIRVPLGVMTFLGPVLSQQFSVSLTWATATLVAVRIVAFCSYYSAAARIAPALKRPEGVVVRHVSPLLSFGGWLTVSTIVGPVMLYADRFLIGALLSMTAVAYYTTPYEVLSRVQVIPNSLLGVLFPAFATAFVADAERFRSLYDRAGQTLQLIMVPLMAALFLFAPELLRIWVGADFSEAAAPVTRWLTLGWLHVLIARTNSTVLQATGRPDLLAKAHLCELFPFLGIVWWMTHHYGIGGAAFAWCLRGVADAIILSLLTGYSVPDLRARAYRGLLRIPLLWLGFACLAGIHALPVKIAIAAIFVGAFAWKLRTPVKLLLMAKAAS